VREGFCANAPGLFSGNDPRMRLRMGGVRGGSVGGERTTPHRRWNGPDGGLFHTWRDLLGLPTSRAVRSAAQCDGSPWTA
jgi:hypothetical protein